MSSVMVRAASVILKTLATLTILKRLVKRDEWKTYLKLEKRPISQYDKQLCYSREPCFLEVIDSLVLSA